MSHSRRWERPIFTAGSTALYSSAPGRTRLVGPDQVGALPGFCLMPDHAYPGDHVDRLHNDNCRVVLHLPAFASGFEDWIILQAIDARMRFG